MLHHGKTGPPCRSCGVQGHKPGDDACKAKPKDKILAFKGYQHPLSNHYPSKLSVYDMDFKSLEAAFFYRMATEFDKTQLAEAIKGAKHAGIVKRLSKDIAEDEDRWKWEEDNTQVMVHLLNAKLDQCPEFRQCLIDNAGLVFAEATPSKIWGTGLSPYITERTSAEYWLGRNLLGALLTEMSQQLVDDAVLSSSSMDSGSNELSGQDTSLILIIYWTHTQDRNLLSYIMSMISSLTQISQGTMVLWGHVMLSLTYGTSSTSSTQGQGSSVLKGQVTRASGAVRQSGSSWCFQESCRYWDVCGVSDPSFLVKKASGGHRLVTAFVVVGRYSKPQPSLMPDVDSTLRQIGQWKYIVVTDLSKAFYQIPLSKDSIKYRGVATPFKGVRVYV